MIHAYKIKNNFKIPIKYNSLVKELDQNVLNDLELIDVNANGDDCDEETINTDAEYINSEKSLENDEDNITEKLYNKIFSPKNEFTKCIVKEMASYYTSDKLFLNDTKQLIKNINNTKSNDDCEKTYANTIEIWNDIKRDTGFNNRYYYIDWEKWKHLNQSELFMQCMSMYNMFSPIMSLLIPLIILIVPFFIIKLRGMNISMADYYTILKTLIHHNSIGRLFTEFTSVSFKQKIYLATSAGFYIFSIYQNILTCINFNKNMKKIHKYLFDTQKYIKSTIKKMEMLLNCTTNLQTYNNFNNDVKNNIKTLQDYNKKIDDISEYKLTFKKIKKIGYVLKTFYLLHDDETYTNTMLYSFGINGYIDCLSVLNQHINGNMLSFAKLQTNNTSDDNLKIKLKSKQLFTRFTDLYYGHLFKKEYITNNVKLNKHMLITGPNASGKTTMLKSVIINVIITQQFGCGFYSKCDFLIYNYIHCYLNIPDTSGRDSLFQAEARRCKEIIDCINDHPNDTHLCAFDELYSGTNPTEAVLSATSFLKFLTKNKNVKSLLTTHYIEICNSLKKNKMIRNFKMKTNPSIDKLNKHEFTYTYKLKKGISRINGGLKVLIDMGFPKEITK
jgi:uncharacterized protein YeeX (DUF496 family)/energy-coupling factor transporter ATP-binding protein EcfA2